MRAVTVVGASLAGLSTARALRDKGFDGRLVVVGDERHAPYDRPPLSKGFLAGTVTEADLALESPDDELDIDWRLGVPATALDTGARRVMLADDSAITSDAVVIATGAAARPVPGALTLRTLDDAVAVRAALTPGARVVLVGAGFIGAEIASTAAELGCDVTVVEAAPTPLAVAIGAEMGEVCAQWHAAHGVRLIAGAGVTAVGPHAVTIADGRKLPADVVIAGIGAVPCVGWLAGSGLDTDGGVLTDSRCATTIPGVYAVGDCARTVRAATGRATRIEHWTNAVTQGTTAAAAVLGGTEPPPPRDEVPYFWSEQYGVRLQFAGHRDDGDEVSVDGDVEARRFVATYLRGGRPVAVLAVNQPKQFGRLRRELITQLTVPA